LTRKFAIKLRPKTINKNPVTPQARRYTTQNGVGLRVMLTVKLND